MSGWCHVIVLLGIGYHVVLSLFVVRSVFYSLQVTMEDFTKAKEKALYRKKGNVPEGLYL